MNVNFGLFPPVAGKKKADRKAAYTTRAREALGKWMIEAAPVNAARSVSDQSEPVPA
jgi:methylenetetrahydrofolate--tRNA-(uracil-5-)-methyltransferase